MSEIVASSSKETRARGTDRVLDILEFLCEQGRPCSIPEIAFGISSPKSTTYVLVEQLKTREYIDSGDNRHFQLGRKVALLGMAAIKRMDFARYARSTVEQLALEANQLAELVALDNWKQIVLIAASGRRPSYLLSAEGSRYPLPRTASSRLLLRDFTPEEIFAGIQAEDYILRDGSIMAPKDFIKAIDEARGLDAVALHGQVDPHLACLASPITSPDGRHVATISLVIPLVDIEGKVEFYANMTRKAACALTEQLSLSPSRHLDVLGLVLQNSPTNGDGSR